MNHLLILQTGQQETERELDATVDEATKQLDKQSLEEKEKDEDDEGKYTLLLSCITRICCCSFVWLLGKGCHCLNRPGK